MLLGDAAHAMSPAGGQGASLSLEDAMLFGRLTADRSTDIEHTMVRFESIRRARAERMVAQGFANDRRSLEQLGLLGMWMRDRLMMPMFASFIGKALNDRRGKLVKTLVDSKLLDGPWDLSVKEEHGRSLVFVSNALSGTVTRLDLRASQRGVTLASATQIASGYAHRCDEAAFVVGPTGVVLDPETDVLYVAATGDNAIFAIEDASTRYDDAGRGKTIVRDAAHLHGPLGLALAPNGDLVSAQGDAVNPNPDPNGQSEIVEFTRRGQFVAQFSVEPATAGAAFGLAVEPLEHGFRFAAVDDALNVLDLWVVH